MNRNFSRRSLASCPRLSLPSSLRCSVKILPRRKKKKAPTKRLSQIAANMFAKLLKRYHSRTAINDPNLDLNVEPKNADDKINDKNKIQLTLQYRYQVRHTSQLRHSSVKLCDAKGLFACIVFSVTRFG